MESSGIAPSASAAPLTGRPIQTGQMESAHSPSAQPELPIRLLLIEDNLELVGILTNIFARAHHGRFVLRAATSLQQGLETINRAPIDAILLDLSLPDSFGGETFRKIRAVAPELPVIILSGTDDEDLALGLVKEGAQDYFIKGESEMHMLPRAIRYAIERNRIEQALEAERNRLRDVINSLPDLVYVKDLHGRYVVNNIAHRTFLGARKDEDVGGRTPFDFLPPEHAQAVTVDDREIMRSRKPVINRLDRGLIKNGKSHEEQWFSSSKVPLLDRRGEVIGLVGVVRDVTERKRIEEGLHASEKQLHALAERLQTVREEDRVRIARELHDRIGQYLAVLRMDLLSLAKNPDGGRESLREKALEMSGLVDSAISAVREICADLRPRMLDDLGLAAALEWRTQEFQKRTGITCEFHACDQLCIGTAASTALFRIAQEALTNIIRHADATEVKVALRPLDGELEMMVEDNGRGITPDEIEQLGSLGLLGMRERVQALGGRISISGIAARGTVVTVRIPNG